VELQLGDLIIVQSQTPVGRLIRWATRSWASHVAVYIGEGLVFEAKPSRAGYVQLSKYTKSAQHKWRVYRLRECHEKRLLFVTKLLRKEGRQYDFLQIGYLFVVSLLGLRGHLSTKTRHNRSICSEVVFEALAEAGIKWPQWKQSNAVPGDFEKWDKLERIY
jgi:hypothetical protein